MIYPLIQVNPWLYWTGILALIAAIMHVAYLLGNSPGPASTRPFFRRFMIYLPRLVLAAQIDKTDQVNAASITVFLFTR